MRSPDGFETVLERRMASAVDGLVADVSSADLRRQGNRTLTRRRWVTGASVVVGIIVLGFALSPRTNPADPAANGHRHASLEPTPMTPPPSTDPTASTASSATSAPHTMPDVLGLPYDEVEAILATLGVHQFRTAWIASPQVPPDQVIAQEPVAGQSLANVELTFSTGGPTIAEQDLPAPARELLGDRLAPGEEVLVVETPVGAAYKVDALLFGPCEAVDAAYRTFLDPRYGDACY